MKHLFLLLFVAMGISSCTPVHGVDSMRNEAFCSETVLADGSGNYKAPDPVSSEEPAVLNKVSPEQQIGLSVFLQSELAQKSRPGMYDFRREESEIKKLLSITGAKLNSIQVDYFDYELHSDVPSFLIDIECRRSEIQLVSPIGTNQRIFLENTLRGLYAIPNQEIFKELKQILLDPSSHGAIGSANTRTGAIAFYPNRSGPSARYGMWPDVFWHEIAHLIADEVADRTDPNFSGSASHPGPTYESLWDLHGSHNTYGGSSVHEGWAETFEAFMLNESEIIESQKQFTADYLESDSVPLRSRNLRFIDIPVVL